MVKTVEIFGFPSSVTAQEVKLFLQRCVGEQSVCAITLRKAREGRKYDAIVEFSTTNEAEHLIFLANQGLKFDSSSSNSGTEFCLKAEKLEHDLIPKQQNFERQLEFISLNCGCKIARDKFHVLWTAGDVAVDFRSESKKGLRFMLSTPLEYRLDFTSESIGQIELHLPSDTNMMYLLIQLSAAPRIYAKNMNSWGGVHGDPNLNYFRDDPHDKWIRATDFTPSYCIGQSSAICLELPSGSQIPSEWFAYKLHTGSFVLLSGYSLSCYQDLVPIVKPSGVDLPYPILFKINMLVQHGYLSWPTLDENFYRLVNPAKTNACFVEYALEDLSRIQEICYEPSKWITEQYMLYSSTNIERPPKLLVDGLVYVYKVKITPSRVYFCGPEPNVSNRVLRHYREDIENFLRVSFVDEDLNKIHLADVTSLGIQDRILQILENGIVIGHKKFEFLACSSSQLRDSSLWMFSPRDGLTTANIRGWMGNFGHIQNVAKYAARLGQSFSSSTETLDVDYHEIEVIPDVVVNQGGVEYVSSDGIGKISEDFAKVVASKCGFTRFTPSAFQIRYGGYKGVVAVDPTSTMKLSLRKSMCKYESDNRGLDVLGWSKFHPCFLNRQIITLLSTCGVPDDVFMEKQRACIAQLDALLINSSEAHQTLDMMSIGETAHMIKELLSSGYNPYDEPFLLMILQAFKASKLMKMQSKTKIFIQDGRLMMGCLDESRTLEYGEVFVQCSNNLDKSLVDDSYSLGGNTKGSRFIVSGKVIVAKSPCLHPGDLRVLIAVDVPDLHHMVDCIVFPQKGSRPHPNECSGSDLDGDMYFVCWDPKLIPPRVFPPMDYTPIQSIKLDHEVRIQDIVNYFADYTATDCLGVISNAHTVFADKYPLKAASGPCLQLAHLFSKAVDYAKTGVRAEMPIHLRPKEYPEFMEKPHKDSYRSSTVIGALYRDVKEIVAFNSPIASFTEEVAQQSYDPDLLVDGYENYLEDADRCKMNYDNKLRSICDYYGIETEAELLSGSFGRMSRSSTKNRDTESMDMAVQSLRKQARTWFDIGGGADDVYAKASAWYFVTYHPSYFGEHGLKYGHLISFPWCVYDKLVDIKKKNAKR